MMIRVTDQKDFGHVINTDHVTNAMEEREKHGTIFYMSDEDTVHTNISLDTFCLAIESNKPYMDLRKDVQNEPPN